MVCQMVIVIQRLQNQSDMKKTTRVGIGPIVKFLLEEKYDYLIDTAKLLCGDETAFQKMSAEEIQFVNKIKTTYQMFSNNKRQVRLRI